jgi:transposase
MANQLEMAIVQSILHLYSLRWSQRRIACELQIDRETVRRCLLRHLGTSNPAISPAGCPGSKPATFSPSPGPAADGVDGRDDGGSAGDANPAISPAGSEPRNAGPNEAISHAGALSGEKPSDASSPRLESTVAPAVGLAAGLAGRPSLCATLAEVIGAKLDLGFSAQRIFQDLREEHEFKGGYDSVKRYVRRLGASRPLPFRRMECDPGVELQVDFGKGAPVIQADGKRRWTHVFRAVLSHSRKGFSEATYRQTTEDFIRCLENAFWYFGGVPQTVVIDNLRAAVKHPDWYDPELNPKLEAFCRHYGTVILPTKSYTPRHKGKVERGVDYVKENGLKGHKFASLQAENQHLLKWEQTVADTRIHGTTKQHVGKRFAEVERAALRPLPAERFPFFHEGQRSVNRNGHVEVAKAYYTAPPEYLGRKVWVRWDSRTVRIFNGRLEQIAIHARREPGRFSTDPAHIPAEKISGVERGAAWLLSKIGVVGPHSRRWSEAVLAERGIEGVRVVQGLLSLAGRHPSEALENACETALSYGAYRLQTVRELIGRRAAKQASFDFLNEHPIIRPLADYSEWLRTTLTPDAAAPRGFGRHGRAIEGRYLEDEEKSPEGQAAIEARAAFHRPDPDIPCRAAPQQAPTPFLQTTPL